REGSVMLQGEDGCRNQYRNLLTIGNSFKRGTYCHLCLAKTNITTNQSVHRMWRFHILLHVIGSLFLVGRILVDEGSLQFALQVSVGAKRIAGLGLTFGV